MKEYPSKNEIEKTLNEIIPFNPQLVSKELSIFDQIVAKSQSEKSPTAQDISRLADTAAPPSTWSIADISDITVSAEEKASVSSIFDINADADVMNVMTAYNPINATKQDAKAQSVLEGLNPYPKLQETEVTTNNDDFVELSKTYGQPEIVRLNDAKTAIDVYTTPQSGSENFTKNTLPTLPGFPAGIKAASILSDSAIEPQYNQVAAINGPQHNRLAPGSAAICSEKMVATAYNYANDKKDKDKASNSKNADKKSKLEYWLDYAEKVMAAGECSNQLVLHYQSFATELLCPGVSEPQATEVQWQTLNIIDEFYSQSYDGWSPLNPLKTYHFNNVPQKVNTVDNKPLVTVSDLQSYSDGMSNRFIYGTLKVNFFYNIGFMIRMVEGKPVVKFFAPSESANSFEPKYNYLFELIGKLYPQAQWGSADAQDIIQDSKIPPVFADSEVFDQTLKPFGQIDTDCVGFYYKSFDREHFARVHIYNVPNATMLIFVDQLDKSDIRFYGKVDKVATIEVKRGESAFDDQIRYAPPRSGNKLAYYILPNHGLYLREAIKTDDTYTLSLVNAWQGGINAIPCQLTLTDDGGYDIQYEQNAAPNKSFVKSYDSFVMVDEKGDKKNYKDLWFNTLVEQDTSSRRLSDIISKGDVEYHYSTNHQGMLRVIISISNHENEGGNLIIACNEKGTRGSLSQYETQNSVHSPEFYPPMPVAHNIQKKSLLPWDHYLQDTEIVFTNDKEKYIDKDRKIVYGEDGKKQKSYFHASCDSMENGWMLYELEQQVTEAEKAASDSRLYGYGKRHQVELQVVNPYGIPLSLPEGACIEYRLSSQARLIDRSNPADPVCIHSNRTVSYTANMVGSSKSVFEINLGHEDDIVAGTSLFYRIVSNDAFEQGDQQAPVMRLNTSTPLQSGESLTTQWKSFNISYKLLQRMDSDHFDQAQPGNSNKTTPAQLLRENADKGKYSDETAKQLAEGYSKLYQVSKPQNGVYL
ncbi:MAG: hypothetical protein HRT35_11360, partial [Algicola sp.]|nr:hypothetical protein [Algicola sp.]